MNIFTKRLLAGGGLGILAGIACAYSAATHGVPGAFDFSSTMFWVMVLNRFTLGVVVAMFGIFTVHPIFTKLKVGPVLRGLDGGTWISLLMATGILIGGQADRWASFWSVIVAGAIIGVVIDLILTKRYGQGMQLLDYQKDAK